MSRTNPLFKDRVDSTIYQLRSIRHAAFNKQDQFGNTPQEALGVMFSDINRLVDIAAKSAVEYYKRRKWAPTVEWDSTIWELYDKYPKDILTRWHIDSAKDWLSIIGASYRQDPRLPLAKLLAANELPSYLQEEMDEEGAVLYVPLSSDLVIGKIAAECAIRNGATQYQVKPVIGDVFTDQMFFPDDTPTIETFPNAHISALVDNAPYRTTRPSIIRHLRQLHPNKEIF